MSKLSGRVAVVTGASSGIGAATARALGARNASVVVAARRTDRIEALAKEIVRGGGHAVAVPCDVSDRAQVDEVVATALRDFGRVDVLVNNAGIMPLAPMTVAKVEDWERTIDVNVKGVLYAIAAVLPPMLAAGRGDIVNVSSVAGRHVFPTAAVYCASKFAVHAISDGLRGELAEQAKTDGNAIRVTVVAPGVVKTELPGSIADDATRGDFEAYVGSMRAPLRSEDIADAILHALEAPDHVGLNEILVRPREQVR
jgi:NADP-dependent 3-hydroxy acid dehydrogenase YdfG